jgi:hypothetical protein
MAQIIEVAVAEMTAFDLTVSASSAASACALGPATAIATGVCRSAPSSSRKP